MINLKRSCLIILLFGLWACEKKVDEEVIPEPTEVQISPKVAHQWANMTLKLVKESPENSPTYTSRTLAYAGVTMYESIVSGSIIFKSVASQLSGLSDLPSAQGLDWETSLSAGQAGILKALYPHTSDQLKEELQNLHSSIVAERKAAGVPDSVLTASAEYGQYIATVIFEWSKNDNGHEGFMRTFDYSYTLPQGIEYWVPPRFGQSSINQPLHPYWGQNRLFVPANEQLEIPEIDEYSAETSSAYYKDMKEVYDKNISLTQEEKETALWWGDDPAGSASPPGHSYYLAAKLVNQEQNNLFEAASVFAKVGMAVSDAFVRCFKCKYHYHAERPTAFIRRYIDSRYTQFWPEPPFPAFTSGHSTQSAAAATTLISVFGDDITYTDDFHEGRPKDSERNVEFRSREFTSIWAFAEECGWSRILGGIHTQQDNIQGLEEGKRIGENINALNWKY
jgi:hypothetical protein